MSDDWCCKQLQNLKIKEQRLTALNEIRSRLNETPNLEVIVTNKLLKAAEIYDCLNIKDVTPIEEKEQIDVATDILTICMANLSIEQNDLPELLNRALTHSRPMIRALAYNTILKELQRHPEQASDMISNDLVTKTLDAMQESEIEVSVPAQKILTIVLENRLEQQEVKDSLMKLIMGDEIIKCRAYELAVSLAVRSPQTLSKIQYLLDSALAELDNNDILVQVNILEILVPLAGKNHGLLYLDNRQVFEIITSRVEALTDNPLDRLLIPGIMKFFGKIASRQPKKIILGYPAMVNCLFDCLLTASDITLLPVAFDTFANLAMTQEGKILLNEFYSDNVIRCFVQYANYIKNLSTDLRNRAFNSLEIIFSCDGEVKEEVNVILQNWFTYLADGPNMEFLLNYCKNPFPDIKVACLSLIIVLCQYDWGLRALRETAGFLEYLLDRKVEFDKEVKYRKFKIIELMSNSTAFDAQTNATLRTYINQGPFYIDTAMDVATEGD